MIKQESVFSNEEQLAIFLSYQYPTEEEQAKLGQLCQSSLDWDRLAEITRINKTAPLAYINLNKSGLWPQVPDSAQKQIEQEYLEIKKTNTERLDEARIFLSRFVQENIPVAILKGVAFGETVYQNPAYKRMNDIDILIHQKDLPKIYEIYDSLDYFFVGERLGGEKEKSDNISFTAPTYISRNMKCVIGTQWGIKSAMLYTIDYRGIWQRSVDLDFYGSKIKELGPEDNLHHLCLHLGFYKVSIRDLMDFYNLLRCHQDTFDWELFGRIVDQTQSQDHVYHALCVTNELCQSDEMTEFIESLRPRVSPKIIKATDYKLSNPRVLLYMAIDYFQDIEKAAAEFFIENSPRLKWKAFRKMYKMLVWPEKEQLLKLNLLFEANPWDLFVARLKFPYNFLWTITKFEISPKEFFFLILYTNYRLAKSSWLALRGYKQPSKEEYARSLGITADDLDQLRDSFQ
jgi:hypothetical protein